MELIKYVNSTFEEEMVLYDISKNQIVLRGDCYHDKIEERIEGFLSGLKYCNEIFTIENYKLSPIDPLFESMGFSNEYY